MVIIKFNDIVVERNDDRMMKQCVQKEILKIYLLV